MRIERYQKTVEEAWRKWGVAFKLRDLWLKLNLVKDGLKQLQNNERRVSHEKVTHWQKQLDDIQTKLQEDYLDVGLYEDEITAKKNPKYQANIENDILRQKARATWIK